MNDAELIEAFLSESFEHLETVEEEILTLERGPAEPETVNHLFRALHTVKGSSSLLGLKKITALSHKLESVLGKIRSGDMAPEGHVTDRCSWGWTSSSTC